MKTKNLLHIFLLNILIVFSSLYAGEVVIGIKEKLGQKIPLDLEFTNENGEKVVLGELFDKPVILSLVYYRCPGICTPLLNDLQTVVDKVDLEPNKDFRIITISIDPEETPEAAKIKKRAYMAQMKRKKNFPDDAWHFFVGNQENITKIAEAIGFRYVFEENEFRHAATLTVLSPDGTVARYLYGTTFLPFDLNMAIIEASEGRVGPTIAKVLKLCFTYDAKNKKYTLNVVRISGIVSVLFVSLVISFLFFTRKKNTPQVPIVEQ